VFRGQGIPHGDGAPAILIPGFMAGDSSLKVMRGWLQRIGYEPHASGIAINIDCSDRAVDGDGVFLCWRAGGLQEAGGALFAEASVDIFARGATEGWERTRSRHVQRHWSAGALRAVAEEAGLELVASVGQRTGARLEAAADERRHTKTVHVARRRRDGRPPAATRGR